jgi:hypothetical protein
VPRDNHSRERQARVLDRKRANGPPYDRILLDGTEAFRERRAVETFELAHSEHAVGLGYPVLAVIIGIIRIGLNLEFLDNP